MMLVLIKIMINIIITIVTVTIMISISIIIIIIIMGMSMIKISITNMTMTIDGAHLMQAAPTSPVQPVDLQHPKRPSAKRHNRSGSAGKGFRQRKGKVSAAGAQGKPAKVSKVFRQRRRKERKGEALRHPAVVAALLCTRLCTGLCRLARAGGVLECLGEGEEHNPRGGQGHADWGQPGTVCLVDWGRGGRGGCVGGTSSILAGLSSKTLMETALAQLRTPIWNGPDGEVLAGSCRSARRPVMG